MKLFAILITNNATVYGGVQPLRQVVLFVCTPFDKNVLGDVIGIRNWSGTLVGEYEYDAWGNITYQYGSMAEINEIYKKVGVKENCSLTVTDKGHFGCEDIIWQTILNA